MSILLLGLNHRTAPVELREQLAFSREGATAALMLFKELCPNAEAAILSTCNRVEILAAADNLTAADLVSFLARARNLPAAAFSRHLYQLADNAAMRHLFRVISGLDSMVLGEVQIVNQLKSAYEMAHEHQTAGPVLHRLFHHAFGVSKRVRSETALSEGKTSMSSVAVDLIERSAPESLEKQRILLVGAGDVAQLAVQHLRAANARNLVITTRTLQNARTLAEACGGSGQAVPFADLDEELPLADVVITCTACRTAILTAARIRSAMLRRQHKPQLLIDLSVPRNIDADVATLPNVTLFDVDALGARIEQARRQRIAAVETAEEIVTEEVAAFDRWLAESKVGPLIQQMFNDVRTLAQIEVRATFRKCPELSNAQRQAIEQLADRLVAKLMHPCVNTLRQTRASEPAQLLAHNFHTTRLNVVAST